MTDWFLAALFVSVVMSLSGSFMVCVLGLACWLYDKWDDWKHPKPVQHAGHRCPRCECWVSTKQRATVK